MWVVLHSHDRGVNTLAAKCLLHFRLIHELFDNHTAISMILTGI